jgi:3-dehydroquinate dehydratase-2
VSKTVYLLNGPNLNLLGERQPDVYGRDTLDDAEALCRAAADKLGLSCEAHQSNHEGGLVDLVQAARGNAAGIIINPGAYSHTSIAILDALNMFEGPVIEVHVSQIEQREPFRHHSFVSQRADAVIKGCGIQGYALAMQRMGTLLTN